MANYPFGDEFIETVNRVFDIAVCAWNFLLQDSVPDGSYLDELEASGYPRETVRQYMRDVVQMPTTELIALALRDHDIDHSPALYVLQLRHSREVFEQAQVLCRSNSNIERSVGVSIIMRNPGAAFRREAVELVRDMAQQETDNTVLEILAYALCHLNVEGRTPYLTKIAANPNAETRQAAAFSLGGLDDDMAIECLISLSRDENEEVRNWATFGLGLGEIEKLQARDDIRDALFERTSDSHAETRHEALVALALYKDLRVVKPISEALQSNDVWELTVEAAAEIAHPDLFPHLVELSKWWDLSPELLKQAVENCSPESK